MKVTFEQKELLHALNLINGVCGGFNTLPILSCVLIHGEDGSVEITGNNLELAVQIGTPALLERDGALAIPFKQLHSLVKVLPSDATVLLEAVKGKSKVTCAGDTYNIHSFETDDYPANSEIAGETFTMLCRDLQTVLRQTAFAASKDEVRYTLNSIYFNFGSREVVATNGNTMLACVSCSISAPEFLLPLETAKTVLKVFKDLEADITITVGDNVASFVTDGVRLTSRLVGGEYPPYQKLLKAASTYKHNAIVSKSEMLDVLKRVSIFSNDRTPLLVLEIGDNEMKLSCEDMESGNSVAKIACSCSHAERIGMDVYGLLEILSHIESDAVVFEYNDPRVPIVVRPEGSMADFMCMIMPMRLDGKSE